MQDNEILDLEADALALLQNIQNKSAIEQQVALKSWTEKSKHHEVALSNARLIFNAAKQRNSKSLGRIENKIIQAEVAYEKLKINPRPVFGVVAMATLCLAVTLSFLETNEKTASTDALGNPSASKPGIQTQTIRSQFGQNVTKKLVDGSTLWLDWESEITIRFDSDQRHITLIKGRAAFDVEKDISRPFIVDAGGWQTTVTGTQFTVAKYDWHHVGVEVSEGSVVLSRDTKIAQIIKPEQRIEATIDGIGEVKRKSIDEIIAWREGMLVFSRRPLEEALNELRPYLTFELDLRYVPKPNALVDATFFTEQADSAISILLAAHQLELERQSDNSMRIRSQSLSD